MKTLATVCATLSLIAMISTAVLPNAVESNSDRAEQHEAFGMGIKEQSINDSSAIQPSAAPVVRIRKSSASTMSRNESRRSVKSAGKRHISAVKSPRQRKSAEVATAVTVREVHRSHKNSPIIRTPRVAAIRVRPVKTPVPEPIDKPAAKVGHLKASANRPDKVALLSNDEAVGKKSPDDSGVSAGMVASTIFKLAIVLGLVYVTILLLKKLSGKQIETPRSSRNLRVLDTVRLSQNSTVHVIDVKGKTLLIGCSSGQVNLLQELETAAEQPESAEIAGGKFAEYLEKYSEKSGQATPTSRMAGLLRDCTAYIQNRRVETSKAGTGVDHVS